VRADVPVAHDKALKPLDACREPVASLLLLDHVV
jgi:hypothetical protein